MDSNQNRIILALAAALLVLSLWWAGAGGPSDDSLSDRVWSWTDDQVVGIEITRAEERLAFEREDDGWRMTAPIREPRVDTLQMSGLLSAIVDMRRTEVVASPGTDGTPFGLGEPPNVRVLVQLASGARHEIEVGQETPVGFGSYVRDQKGGVIAVAGDAARVLRTPASRFRDHRVLWFDPAEVRAVEVRSPQGTLRAHGEQTLWWLDGFGRADADRVDDLVMGLLDLRFAEILDLEDDLLEAERSAQVSLTDGSTHSVRVGQSTPLGTLVWASDGRRGTVADGALRLLEQGPTDLGDGSAFGISPDRSDRIEAALGDTNVLAVRLDDDWSVEGSEGSGVIDALAQVPVTYAWPPPDASPHTWGSVSVSTGPENYTVVLGPPQAGFHVARDTRGGAPYRIAVEDLAALE